MKLEQMAIRKFTPSRRQASRALVQKWTSREDITAQALLGVMTNYLVLTGQAGRFKQWLAA